MTSSTLFETICLFSPENRTRLRLFLQSPLLVNPQKQGDEIRLLTALLDHLDGKRPTLPDKNEFGMVILGKQLSNQTLENLKTKAMAVVRYFFAVEKKLQTLSEPAILLHTGDFFKEKQDFDKSEQWYKRTQEKLNTHIAADNHEIQLRFDLENEISDLEAQQMNISNFFNLPNTFQTLNRYFFTEFCRLTAQMLSLAQHIPAPNDTNWTWHFGFLDDFAQTDGVLKEPITRLLYQACQLLRNEKSYTIAEFQALLEEVAQHAKALHPEVAGALQSILNNYCTQRINLHKDIAYHPLLHKLHRNMVESKTAYTNGLIHPITYSAIVNQGLRVGEFEWVLKFIEGNKKKVLDHDKSDEHYKYSKANYYFFIKAYDQALSIVESTRFRTLAFQVRAKAIEIQSYYETGNPILDDRLNSAKGYFQRLKSDKFPQEKIDQYNEFLNITRQLLNHGFLAEPEKMKGLEQRVEENLVAEQDWLLEKIRAKMVPSKRGKNS